MSKDIRIIAFYLPQFHPIPENDAWWGKGFTEWTNVAIARPRFKGHYQPHVPADLGFYDLRLEETRIHQAEIAGSYGVSGFCYYHYWFNGKRLLNKPLDAVLQSGKPDFPFCLCWANENWTRAWDGLDRQVLIHQDYLPEDNDRHIKWLLEVFKDQRYIKIDGKPLFLLYRVDLVPEPEELIEKWQKTARSVLGTELYFCAVKNSFLNLEDSQIIRYGFNALIDFQPNRNDFPVNNRPVTNLYNTLQKVLPPHLYQFLKLNMKATKRVDYKAMIETIIRKEWDEKIRTFPSVFPTWDNSARRQSSLVIQNDDSTLFLTWLEDSVRRVSGYPHQEKLVFINAWNEWAEGCHLEPDRKNGYRFLEAVRDCVQ